MLVSEYQSFMAELQQKDFRQLFGIAKARFQRAAGLHPLSKGMLSKGIQFIDLARSEPPDLLCFLAYLPPYTFLNYNFLLVSAKGVSHRSSAKWFFYCETIRNLGTCSDQMRSS